MLPIKDENPTHRTPVVTVAIIAACLYVFFLWQPTLAPGGTVEVETAAGIVQFDAVTAFNFEHAAIPCEVTQGRPLTIAELRATFQSATGDACGVGSASSPEVFTDKTVWTALLTSMFLHGSLFHLGSNLLFLWIFGNNIEDHLGHVRFAAFYIIGGLAASAAHIGLNLDSTIPVVGASGAIAAVMGAYLIWFPAAPVRTLIFVFFFVTMADIRARTLLIIWFVMQFFTSPNSGVAWAAHVGGFVFGVVVGLIVRRSSRIRRATWTPDYRTSYERRWDDTGGIGYQPYRSRRLGRGD